MGSYNRLTLEQELSLIKISNRVKALSHEQAQRLIVELQRQIMIKDNLYKKVVQQESGR